MMPHGRFLKGSKGRWPNSDAGGVKAIKAGLELPLSKKLLFHQQLLDLAHLFLGFPIIRW